MSIKIREMISHDTIMKRIRELGEQITADYQEKEIRMICVLKGGVFFFFFLAREIRLPVSLDFMSASSYGAGTESSGVVNITKDLDESITGRHVLVVEDIIDSGRTLALLLEVLKDRDPASLRLCTLLDKPDRRVTQVPVDYCGFTIPDEYIVGYGLDLDQKYRNIPYIGIVEED